jgi:L-arabinose isomerase
MVKGGLFGIDLDTYGYVGTALVAASHRSKRLGILGHYSDGMLDVYTDLTKQSSVFGAHFGMLEMCELTEMKFSE